MERNPRAEEIAKRINKNSARYAELRDRLEAIEADPAREDEWAAAAEALAECQREASGLNEEFADAMGERDLYDRARQIDLRPW